MQNTAPVLFDTGSEAWRLRSAEKQREAIESKHRRSARAHQPRVLSSEEKDIVEEATRLGAEWRAMANQEGF
jgi:hypothetical protein